jgi:hypothetical protein
MKFKKFIAIVSIILLSSFSVYAEDDGSAGSADTTSAPAATDAGGGNDAKTDLFERIILENFEESEDWRAKSTTPIGETKLLKMVQRGIIKDVFDSKALPVIKDGGKFKSVSEKEQLERNKTNKNHVMGVKTYFHNRGFDRVEVSPPHEYIIKGKVRQVSVWVLGRKYNHTLYAKFRDYRGKLHSIRLGKLDFFGWRKLTATVPGYIPQSTRFSLQDKNLQFVSIYVTSDTHEVGGDFYFYVDDLEVYTDRTDMIYPGYEIKDNW